ncbi:unnamed protein product [Clonostachys rhizophaga]|uniref:SGNH hydrolase-type esterase domain-containing protein n=1 Tax=Clonostachys rhizophaga TaxID=160324 RepID=A0A9N9VGW3_9HYPO|nr:unnamed protein product [Clonostachys rhizophaga]
MRLSFLFCGLVAALAHAQPLLNPRAEKPPYFIVTGDSTTNKGTGWGEGFISNAQNGADGVIRSKGGTTTVTFKTGGWWDKAIQSVKDNKDKYRPIVTIQFGHNDQKADSGISLSQFQNNMKNLAEEVKSAGGIPVGANSAHPQLTPSQIIITSLARRVFHDGKASENLKDWADAAKAAAKAAGAKYLDLNRASTDYLNKIGETNAAKYDKKSGDKTHLNAAGSTVFGRIVTDLMGDARPDLKTYLKENKKLSDKIAKGDFATGNE